MHRISILGLLLFATTAFSQNISEADKLFKAGEYEKAKQIYVQLMETNQKAADRYDLCLDLIDYYSLAKENYQSAKYNSAIKYCDVILQYNPDCAKSLSLKQQCKDAIGNLQRQRELDFERARKLCSNEALAEFRSKYANQPEQIRRADTLANDMLLWRKSSLKKTRDGYEEYLLQTSAGYYVDEATDALAIYDCESEWNRIKDSRDKADFVAYKSVYGKYNLHVAEADEMISLISANSYYASGSKIDAYNIYRQIENSSKISMNTQEQQNYKDCRYYYLYQQALDSEAELKNYISRYPESPYIDAAKRKLEQAKIARANKLEREKEKYKQVRKETRKRNRNSFFSYCSIGVGLELSLSMDLSSDEDVVYTYNPTTGLYESSNDSDYSFLSARMPIGLLFRVGHYDNKLNFITGAQYLVRKKSFVIPAHLRLNFIESSISSYLGLVYKAEFRPSEVSGLNSNIVGLEIGLWDDDFDINLFVDVRINPQDDLPNTYLGASLMLYFGSN